MIALARTYQDLLVFGIGYIPVYIQYFGACILLIGIALYFNTLVRSSKIKKYLSLIYAIALCILFLINLQNNRLIVEKMNQAYWYPRNILEVSGKNKLFDRVPTTSTLIMESDDNLSLDYPPFIYFLTKRDIFTLNSKKILTWYKNNIKPDSSQLPISGEKYFIEKGPVYFFRYWSDWDKRGYVVLSKVSDFKIDHPNSKKTPVKINNLKIFFLGNYNLDLNVTYTSFSLDSKGNIEKKSVVTIPKNSFENIQKSGNNVIFSVPIKLETDYWIDFQSIRLNPLPELPYPTNR